MDAAQRLGPAHRHPEERSDEAWLPQAGISLRLRVWQAFGLEERSFAALRMTAETFLRT